MTQTRRKKAVLQPAHGVVNKLGGDDVVAEITGLSTVTIWRWQAPKADGGTGGKIPGDHQQFLLDYARAHGLPLTERDFFMPHPPEDPGGPSEPAAYSGGRLQVA